MARRTDTVRVGGQTAGTGGVLVLQSRLLAEKFFLLNGDSFMNVDWESLTQCLGDNPRKEWEHCH